MDEPKIYVRAGTRSWYYYRGEVYAGSESMSPLVVLSWEPLQLMVHGNTYYVVNEDVQEVHRQETSHTTKAPVYLILSREKARHTKAWDKIFELYPPDSSLMSASFKEKMKNACKKIWEYASAHLYAMLVLTIITIVSAIVVQYVRSTRSAPELPKSDFTCTMCWLDQDQPYYSDSCPGSPDYNCAKGKGRRKYSNFVNVN